MDLLILLFPFQFALFLGSMQGLFLMFPFAFVFTSLVAHICPPLLDDELHRTALPNTLLRSFKLAHEIVMRHS